MLRVNLALLALERGDLEEARACAHPVLEARMPWMRAYALGVQLAATLDAAQVDLHLDALERMESAAVPPSVDYVAMLQTAASRWAQEAPHRAARLRCQEILHLDRHGLDPAEAEAGLRALRAAGAEIPLGPLALDERVRAGGMGQVWRGVVRGADTGVAVKVLDAERSGDARVADALSRELRTVARLDHPHIAPVVDHGTLPRPVEVMSGGALVTGTPWMAAEWARHGTLEPWCGRRPWSEVRAALLQLLDALAAAHAADLLHLDVKPANILVADLEPPTIWLADFGVAHALGAGVQGRVSGTPTYMAPEQGRGDALQLGPWTDLYAVGATVIELVQGEAPFEGTPREILQQHQLRPVPLLRPTIAVPEGLQGWIERLMAKRPNARFATAADAAAALSTLGEASVAAGQPLSGRPSVNSSSTFMIDAVVGQPAEVELDPPAERAPVAPVASSPPSLPFRTLSPRLAQAAYRLLPHRQPPLVGHVAARRALWEALVEVGGGARVVGLVAGPSGGRTRLMRWLAEAARRSGAAHVLWIGGADGEAWRTAILGWLGLSAADPETARSHLARQLALHVGPESFGPTEIGMLTCWLTGTLDERASFDPQPLALRILQELSRTRRALVCIDSPSIPCEGLITQLMDPLRRHPILVVARADGLPDRADVDTLELAEVDSADIGALIDAMLPLAPALRDRLEAASARTPATVVWTLRAWLANRDLGVGPQGLHTLDDQALPAHPGDAIGRLLEPVFALEPSHRQQARLAAVLGLHVDRAAWSRACDAAGLPSWTGVAAAMTARGLLVERPSGFDFTDRHVRERVLAEVAPEALPALHRAVAMAVEEDELRAHHLMRAGDATAALEPLARALTERRTPVPSTGARLARTWDAALAAADLPDDHPLVVRGSLGRWQASLPGEEAVPEIERRTEQARRLGDRDGEARGLLLLAIARKSGMGTGIWADLTRRALALAVDPHLRGVAHKLRGLSMLANHEWEEAAQAMEDAVAAGNASASYWLAAALHGLGRVDEALSRADSAAVASGEAGYHEHVVRLCLAAKILHEAGHVDLARRRWAEAEAIGAAYSPIAERTALDAQVISTLEDGDEDRLAWIVERLTALPPSMYSSVALALLGSGDAQERWDALQRVMAKGWRTTAMQTEFTELVRLAAERPEWAERRDDLLKLVE